MKPKVKAFLAVCSRRRHHVVPCGVRCLHCSRGLRALSQLFPATLGARRRQRLLARQGGGNDVAPGDARLRSPARQWLIAVMCISSPQLVRDIYPIHLWRLLLGGRGARWHDVRSLVSISIIQGLQFDFCITLMLRRCHQPHFIPGSPSGAR